MVRSTTRGGGYPTLAAARDARSRATPSRIGLRGVHSVPSGTPPSRAPPSVPSRAPPSVPSGRHKRILLPPSPSSSDMFDDALPSPSDPSSDPLHDPLSDPLHDLPSDPPLGDSPSPTSSTASTSQSRTPIHIMCKDSLFPGDAVSKFMTNLYKQRLCPEGYTWSKVSKETRDWYWSTFQKSFTYPVDMEQQIYLVWHRHAGKRYADFMCELRKAHAKPPGLSQLHWDSYWKEWSVPKFQDKCKKMSANRRSEVEGEGSGMSVHTGGSRSADRYARELAKQLGRKPNNFEVYKALHWDKTNSKWADTKSQKVALKIESLIANDQSLADDSNIDQSERNKRIDDHYMTAVGGTSKKQRIYGIGKFGASQAKDETPNDSTKETRKSGHRNEKVGRKKKHSHYSSSDDGLERIKSGSRKKKKWYDSDEDMSSFSESDSQSEVEREPKKRRSSKKEKKRHGDSLDNEYKHRSKKKSRSRRKDYSSENESSTSSEREKSSEEGNHHKRGMSKWKEDEKWGTNSGNVENDLIDDSKGSQSLNSNNIVRKELGLEWMLRPKDAKDNISRKSSLIEPEEAPAEEIKKDNPRELNPYLKDSGSGYPEESDGMKAGNRRLLSNVVVGDGGASWRLKALKRAQEQAAREGRKLQEVVEERWGSMGHLAASVASHNVAPTHAHLRAIKNRRKELLKEEQTNIDEENNRSEKKSMKDVVPRHPKMRVPKVHDSLSWAKRGSKNLSTEDAALVSTALSSLNKFSNDGNFLDKLMHKEEDNSGDLSNPSKFEARPEPKSVDFASVENKEDAGAVKLAMSANQLAAKALQLRMKGKHEEAEKLLKEAETIKERQNIGEGSSRLQIDGTTSRFIMHDVSARKNKKEDDGDLHLAQKIMHNHRYSISNQADEEYDYDDGPRKKNRKKGGGGNYKSSEITNSANRFLTQQERCQFCFENPSRPKHLVIAIANFTYLALPQQQPVVPGHCGILTLQHESSTRTVEDNVWDEIRNFKKCLIMMFAKQEKDVVFFETVMGLAQQRRHCLVECVPLPRDVAKQAPVYFKKAIDEAEDEWSQHNAKKLIDTSEKGLRGSIPKNFPYFHVEFGLNKGFVHVIDDEKEFKSNFGLNVIRGILQLPAEDMYRRRRQESLETQKQAVASFARDWEPFDWTKQLD